MRLLRQLFFVLMLIMFFAKKVTAQDTVVTIDKSIENIIRYNAKDSIFTDLKSRKIHLYGQATVEMEDTKMSAGYILVDLNSSEITASYRYDKDSNKVEFPTFSDGTELINCERMRFNTKTKKGFLEELAIKQDEFYFKMGTAKRQANEEVHLLQGRLTTCDLQDPHYHFQLAKGVIVPEERIVTGPMNLWLNGIPTPFGLPFAIIPTKKRERTNGLLFPEFIPLSNYGFGFQNLGYYFPISDYLQTSVYANLYSRGSWGLRNDLDYAKKYGFSGKLSLGFQQFRSGFPENSNQNKVSVVWSHRKEPKSNPYWNFASNVNFISDNNSKNNLDPINPEYFSNSFNSDININRLFPGKPLTTGMKVSLRQNSIAKDIALVSPILNVNLTRVFPFRNLFKTSNKEWKKTIERIGFTYNFEGQNRSNFADTLLSNGDFQRISQQFFNGFSQNINLQTTTGLFSNAIKITPGISYGNKMNFQQVNKTYNSTLNNTTTDTLNQFGMAHEFNLNVNMTTILYSYYQFIGKNKPKIRHLMTPSIGYRFVPLLNPLQTANVGVNQSSVSYSVYERSIYNVGNTSEASFLTFGINNTLEMKFKSDKDTVTGFKKVRLVDQFSINGNYDFTKDSMKLSNISLNLRISPFDWLNFVSNANFSPYGWVDSTGKTISDYAIQNGQGLGRFLSTNFNTSITIAPKKSREKIAENNASLNDNWRSDFNFFALHPEQAIYFEIPWKMSLSHVLSFNANQSISANNKDAYFQVQTLVLNGDVTFTKRWNLSGNVNFNLKDGRLTNAYFSLNRNLHCWMLSFYWVPIGGNKSFLFSIRNSSSIFKDAKIEIRKPPAFL
jgi:hypothetical protein